MKRLKPETPLDKGSIVDEQFLPESLRSELLLSLKRSPLTKDQQRSLINYANTISQSYGETESASYAKQRDEIKAVAQNARRLLASINLLSESARKNFESHSLYLLMGSAPPVTIPKIVKTTTPNKEHILSPASEWISAVELAGTYAASQYKIDRQSKPEQYTARSLVGMMAQHVQLMTGTLPPVDPSAWFAEFMESLGRHLDLRIGWRILKSGVEVNR